MTQFKTMYARLVALMAEERPMAVKGYEPDDVFDTHGLFIDIGDTVDVLNDDQFREAALDRLEMDPFFCGDCGEVAGGTIEMCGDHLNEWVEMIKVHGV